MEEKIKEIISVFIKVPTTQIGPATVIGRSALQSSILLHRMYARLAEEGVVVENYGEVKVFADLFNGTAADTVSAAAASTWPDPFPPGIGIDIEEIAALPRTTDFRKEGFYTMNFTATEIAYCILQADPYSSFAGLFAVKEAIIKADGRYKNRIFNSIEIGHSPEGKPLFPGIDISISHAGGMAVAVAAPSGVEPVMAASVQPAPSSVKQGGSVASWVAWIALLLSVMALSIALMR